jgi:dipeptidyl aminopeptidase/acylaminoacyl peptidase
MSLAVGGLVQCLMPTIRRLRHNDVGGFIYAVLGVAYGVLLGLVVVAVWEEWNAATGAADNFQEVTQPSWSPDGTEIAFSAVHSDYHAPGKGYRAIFKIDVNSLEETRLTKGSDTETSPTWSPDGEKIAYVRDTSNTSSIYMVGSDGSAQTLVRVFPSRDFPFGVGPPDWRPSP